MPDQIEVLAQKLAQDKYADIFKWYYNLYIKNDQIKTQKYI